MDGLDSADREDCTSTVYFVDGEDGAGDVDDFEAFNIVCYDDNESIVEGVDRTVICEDVHYLICANDKMGQSSSSEIFLSLRSLAVCGKNELRYEYERHGLGRN